jgi:hypothetical protein
MTERYEGPERRREPRYPVDIPVTVMRGAARCPGRCLDLSSEGLLVELSEELETNEGELLRVEVAEPNERVILLTVAVARRVERKVGLALYGISGDPEQVWRAVVRRVERAKLKAAAPP